MASGKNLKINRLSFFSTRILASGKMVTVQKILASGKMVTAQEYWPVVRWLQYKNIGQW